MQISWTRLPFRYGTTAEYEARLTDFIGTAFYERLPAAGYEIREEQIYTAYRIARAMARGETFLAEAGTGTGKTFAYLIPAICHARLRGKPVVIACASDALLTQLAGPGGDATVLSDLVGLQVDARIASDPHQTVCELKADLVKLGGVRKKGMAALRKWADTSPTGHRSEVPDLPDDLWDLVAWDDGLPCDTCRHRGYCRSTRARERYRKAADLVICSHDLFFDDLVGRRERLAEGKQPLLPPYSGVVFDEGHRAPEAARLAAGFSLRRRRVRDTLLSAATAKADKERPRLTRGLHEAVVAADSLWEAIAAAAYPSETARFHLRRDPAVAEAGQRFAEALETAQDLIAMEEGLLPTVEQLAWVKTLQARLDHAAAAVDLLLQEETERVAWVLQPADPQAAELVVAPRGAAPLFRAELYDQRVPVLFTSATLGAGHDFAYLKRLVGAPGAGHSQAGTPFDFARQALVYTPSLPSTDVVDDLLAVLRATDGRALVLLRSPADMAALRARLEPLKLPWRLLWESDGERGELLRRFRADTGSVLLGHDFWEGIDVPGEALSCVVVPHLPFPPDDPLAAARRADVQAAGLDPFAAADLPWMALRLKQGCGRLIRTARDRGVFALLDTRYRGTAYEAAVESAFPDDAESTQSLERVRQFLAQ